MSKFEAMMIAVLFFILFFPMIACEDDRPLNLDRNDIKYIDSVFFSKRDSLTKLADSLCDDQYPILLSSAIDSIKAIRLEEIESILGK